MSGANSERGVSFVVIVNADLPPPRGLGSWHCGHFATCEAAEAGIAHAIALAREGGGKRIVVRFLNRDTGRCLHAVRLKQ